MSLHPGDVIDDKYRIVRLLGEGGMGAVYEGENLRIHRRVAIKVLHAQVAQSADAVQRFEREAQAAGRIGSEHIVEVLDLGILPAGDRYMVMEFLDGQALTDRIEARKRLSPQAAATVVVQMLEGLQAAHSAGIIHRDLKPDNVFLLTSRAGQRDFVKILDFGISKFNTLGGEFSMTRTGAVMGTPFYMSPEQAKGNRDIDLRADLYATGVILYEAVAGEVPFNAETFNELLFKIVLEQPVPLAEKVEGLDPHFAAIVQKAMAREPDHRFQSASELQEALRGWLAGAPPSDELVAGDRLSSGGAATLSARPSAAPGMRSTGADRATQGAWAATGTYPAPAKSAGGKYLIVAAAVVLLGGAAGAWALKSSNDEEARIAAAAAEQAAQEVEARRAHDAAELARLDAERAKAEADRLRAERARLEAETSKVSAVAAAQRLRVEQELREKEEAARNAAARAARAARAASAPAKPAAPEKAPSETPAPAAPEPTGRVIRTNL